MFKKNKEKDKKTGEPAVTVTVSVPPEVAVAPKLPEVVAALLPWRSGEFENKDQITAAFNKLESDGYVVTFFDFERKFGGQIEVVYRAEKVG